jgi:triosephosphate isomerase
MASGAYTGDISAEMLKDAGAVAVIVGHSERRRYYGETDAAVRAKALAAKRAGLLAIVCVGETRAEREAGATLAVVGAQLNGSLPDDPAHVVVAYEPVWAIGTGLTPTAGDVGDVHRSIRQRLGSRYGQAGQGIRILYGGSVNAANARELLGVENVDGALVGGASLKPDEFLAIAGFYR